MKLCWSQQAPHLAKQFQSPVCVPVCLSKGKSNLLARRVSRSPWTTLSSHLTCVYLPISTWADITSVVWSVEVEWMPRLRYGWKVLLKCKVFILSLQTADQSSDSPSCLAASCFKAVWTLGLCGKSEGSNSRAVMQTGVTAFAQIHFLALAGLLIRCCYAGIVLFLICLWPAKGPSASVSLTPQQALWAPHYSFQEESIAILLLRLQRAELTCLCQPTYCEVRAQNEGYSFFHQVHEAHNATTKIHYFLKPFTFYLFCLRQQSLGFLPFKFFSWPTGEGVGVGFPNPAVAMGLGNLEVGSLVHQFQWLGCACFIITFPF